VTVFGQYARFYDLFYRDKDYAGETDYVASLLQRFGGTGGDILELGCGTGRHAVLLAERGYRVHGIDFSSEMLQAADETVGQLAGPLRERLQFERGDVRDYRAGRQFDIAISLFHVMSYQTTNEDLRAAFETAACHLDRGGIFLFDCWYGPGVLTDPPEERTRELEDDAISVRRTARPVMLANANCVDVHYRVDMTEKSTGKEQSYDETHRMRYLFIPEIELLLDQVGMKLVHTETWLTGTEPGLGTWNLTAIGQK
jgi:SAM-dependent methyltransferase